MEDIELVVNITKHEWEYLNKLVENGDQLGHYERLLVNGTPIEPSMVRYEGDGYADGEMVYDYAYCPNCNHETEEDSENWGSSFCPECGQALDWGEMKTL